MMTDGRLYMRQVRESDAGLYHCKARNKITDDLTSNSTKGMLKIYGQLWSFTFEFDSITNFNRHFADSSLTFAPKIVSKSDTSIQAQKGDTVHLCCQIQAYPFPTYRYV